MLPALNSRVLTLALLIVLAGVMLLPQITAPMALLIGIGFALTLGNPAPDRVRGLAGWALKSCVVGLGFGLPMATVIATGAHALWLTGIWVVAVLAAGLMLARAFSLDRDCGRLISSGTAICGGSAIAAVAPVLGAAGSAVSMSLACVFVLNALALLTFPWLGRWLGLSEPEFALWAALAIHDTSSVVAAGAAYGEQALAGATVIKLARALWIVPLVVGFFWLTKTQDRRAGPIDWPIFVGLFVLAAFLRALLPGLEAIFDQLAWLARRGLEAVLFLIGAGLTMPLLRSLGWRPMAFATLLWLAVCAISLVLARSGAAELLNAAIA